MFTATAVVTERTHKPMAMRHISLGLLKNAAHNPARRIKKGIKSLAESIKEVGLLYPIIVKASGAKFEIVEGHRRVAAYRRLDWATIPAQVLGEDKDADRIYAGVNSTMQKHDGNQILSVYLINPRALADKTARKVQRAEDVLGIMRLRRLESKGMSLTVYGTARRAANYCNCTEDDEFVVACFDWMIKHSMTHVVRGLIITKHDPSILVRAIASDSPIRFKPMVKKG